MTIQNAHPRVQVICFTLTLAIPCPTACCAADAQAIQIVSNTCCFLRTPDLRKISFCSSNKLTCNTSFTTSLGSAKFHRLWIISWEQTFRQFNRGLRSGVLGALTVCSSSSLFSCPDLCSGVTVSGKLAFEGSHSLTIAESKLCCRCRPSDLLLGASLSGSLADINQSSTGALSKLDCSCSTHTIAQSCYG